MALKLLGGLRVRKARQIFCSNVPSIIFLGPHAVVQWKRGWCRNQERRKVTEDVMEALNAAIATD